MKSLQVVTPSEPCIYHCPFCISKTHRHFNRFQNVYQEDFQTWKTSLEQVLDEVLFPLIPQKKLVDITDVAALAFFLAQDCAKNITGTNMIIDGGYTAQ